MTDQGKNRGGTLEVSAVKAWRSSALVIALLAFIGVYPMYVEFVEEVGAWAKGSMDDLKENLARSLISIGQARECSAAEFVRSSLDVEAQKRKADDEAFRTEMKELVRSGLQAKGVGGKTKSPPNGGGGVDFDHISATGTPAAEQDKRRCLADAMRCVFLANANGCPPELQTYARERLRGYSDEFTEYRFSPETGEMEQTVTRQLGNGGLETIKRTGTDSLSGGPTYGFTLKPDYIGSLFRIAREQEVFASAARKIPVTQGNEVIWPALDQYRAPTLINGIPQAAVFGGITLSYVGETTARVSSDALTTENRFKIVDLTGMTDFSRDYIVDNYIAMDSEVTSLFGSAIAWMEDWVTIRADGVAKPQGFFNANALLTVTRDLAAHIHYEDIVGMMAKLSPMCWSSARWLANVTCLPDLVAIKNTALNYVYQPNSMIAQYMRPPIIGDSQFDEGAMVSRPMGMLEGLPVYFTEKIPALGTQGDLNLVCPNQYGLAERSGLEVGVSDQFYFSTDRIAYRFKKRHYGQSLWRAAYTQADNTTPASGTKVSPFVQLV